jgi:hypothetical protein
MRVSDGGGYATSLPRDRVDFVNEIRLFGSVLRGRGVGVDLDYTQQRHPFVTSFF